MSSAPDQGRTCSQLTRSQHRWCPQLGFPFSEPTPMTARHYMTLMRSVVLLLLIAAFHALSAQSRVGDSLEDQYRRLSSEPTCKNAVELFQVVDDMVAKAINERGPVALRTDHDRARAEDQLRMPDGVAFAGDD